MKVLICILFFSKMFTKYIHKDQKYFMNLFFGPNMSIWYKLLYLLLLCFCCYTWFTLCEPKNENIFNEENMVWINSCVTISSHN